MAVCAPIYVAIYLIVTYSINENSFIWRNLFPNKSAPVLLIQNGLYRNSKQSTLKKSTTYWSYDILDPRGTVTSYCFPRWALILWRILAISFYIGSFFQMNSTGDLNGLYMTYFTLWTFTFFAATTIVGIAAVIQDYIRFPPSKPQPNNPTHKSTPRWTFLTATYQVCFEIISPASFFIMIFYWAALYKGLSYENIPNQLFVHGLNNVFMLVDLFIARTAFVSTHVLAVLCYIALYAVFYWIYGGVTGQWPYYVMSFTPDSFLYYVFLPVLITIIFFVYLGFAALREVIATRSAKCGCGTATATSDGPDNASSDVEKGEEVLPPRQIEHDEKR